jgi:hypothetical protein
MKIYLIITLLFSLSTLAQVPSPQSKKTPRAQDQMDEGDKQLLKRDVCRKPMEALETRYDNIEKKDLEKMKANCQY